MYGWVSHWFITCMNFHYGWLWKHRVQFGHIFAAQKSPTVNTHICGIPAKGIRHTNWDSRHESQHEVLKSTIWGFTAHQFCCNSLKSPYKYFACVKTASWFFLLCSNLTILCNKMRKQDKFIHSIFFLSPVSTEQLHFVWSPFQNHLVIFQTITAHGLSVTMKHWSNWTCAPPSYHASAQMWSFLANLNLGSSLFFIRMILP